MTTHRLNSKSASAYFQAGRPWGAMPNYVQLDSWSCGFVAALTVVHYYHPATPMREVFDYVQPGNGGCDYRLMVRTLKRFGVEGTYRDRLGRKRLRSLVEAGPVIITVQPWDWYTDHWCVVRDVDFFGRVRLCNHGPPRAGMAWDDFANNHWWPKGGGIVCHRMEVRSGQRHLRGGRP